MYLASLLAAQAEHDEVIVAVGRVETDVADAPYRIIRVAGLDDTRRDKEGALGDELDSLVRELAPAAIHIHNAIAPAVLAWGARRGAAITVQDHRSFCPGLGKLTLQGEVCTDAMEREMCRDCMQREGDSGGYSAEMWSTTSARLAALRAAPAVGVLSQYMARELTAAGIDPTRVVITPPYVYDLDQDAPPSGAPCILFAGRLVSAKGVRQAVEAWRRAALSLPLVFAGTGPLRAELEAEGHEVLGWIPHARMASVYRRAKALLMPPLWQEPFGIVGLEALQFGVPVIAWHSGGIEEWHPGDGLVGRGELDDLATALERLAGTRVTSLHHYDRRDAVAAVEALYEMALSAQTHALDHESS